MTSVFRFSGKPSKSWQGNNEWTIPEAPDFAGQKMSWLLAAKPWLTASLRLAVENRFAVNPTHVPRLSRVTASDFAGSICGA
jgi:hypothetical protein